MLAAYWEDPPEAMRFGKVDIPRDLIEARRKGELAVFAGAGVSIGSPSNLPGFDELVRRVAQDTPRIDPEERNEKRFDRFLGELHRGGEGVSVHEIVQSEIDNPESEPTPLHYELLRLFDDASDVRIVTTNFDRHFTTAARNSFEEKVSHYYAPALPPGDNFSGIAYLHGSLEQSPKHLVLTDEDFSEAYITKGWARRFLQRLFSNFYVLFVGYTHGEAVIEYLARGIPATDDQGRFALDKGWADSDEETTNWEYFGIEPVYFPKAEEENEYAELPNALRVWNRYAEQTARERAERIAGLVDQPPSELNEHQIDAIKDRLSSEEGARHFASEATTLPWLYWALSEGLLEGLFEPGDLSRPEFHLAEWISNQLIPRHPEAVLAVVGPRADQLNHKFWNRIVRELWNNEETGALSSEELSRWVQVLLVSPPPNLHNLALLLSDGLRMPEDSEAALLLFERLTEPVSVFQKGYTHPGNDSDGTEPSAHHEVKLQDRSHQLPRAWEEVLEPYLPKIAPEVESIATANLRKLYRLYESAGRTHPNGETPLSIHRSAIEPHEQDGHSSRQEGEYVLIDAARDSIEWLVSNQPGRGKTTIQGWCASAIPLLERLAIHAVNENPNASSDTKVQWLLDRDWMFVPRLKHEVFQLLGRAYPGAGENSREKLLERIWEEWPDEEEEDRKHKAYRVYNLIRWLADHAEDDVLTGERLEVIKSEFPGFQPREYPSLDSWVGDVEAIQPEDYSEELLRRPPSEQLDQLLEILEGSWFPRQEDSLDVDDVQAAIAKNFEWGYQLIQALAEREKWDEEVWSPIWRGLREAALDTEQWKRLLTFIDGHSGLHSHVNGLPEFLKQRSRPGEGDLPTNQLEIAEKIADSSYAEAHDAPITVGGDANEATRLLNHPGASIGLFYIYALWRRHDERNLDSLPEEYQDRFETILTETHAAAQAAQMVLGSRVSFLYRLDQQWTLENLLPYYGWEEERTGRTVWTGLIFMGQSITPALAQEMKEISRGAFSELSEQPEEFRNRFARFVASLSVSEAIDPLEEGWLGAYLGEVGMADRVRWTGQVANALRRSDPGRVEQIWDGWLRKYWTLRLEGKPPLTSEETSHMIDWVPLLAPVIEEAVDLACRGPFPEFSQRTRLFFSLEEENFGRRYPQAVTRLLRFVLSEGEELRRWNAYQISDVLEDIASADDCPSEGFQDLIDIAIERGYLQSAERGEELIKQC